MRPRWIGPAVCLTALLIAAAPAAADISYHTFFEDPGTNVVSDPSLERHAIDLINATSSGERITFAFRDFDRNPIVNALIAARNRGVEVDGVIDGGERQRAAVQRLVTTLGPDRVVLCGTPTFEWNSCIANPAAFQPSLMHNKFLTFSRLADAREHVVLQTSQNFLFPSQYFYYNDMVEIAGDARLYDTYVDYLFALKAQNRTDDYFMIAPRDGPNTIFTSPRPQPDLNTDDTIVDRLNEIDCSRGGTIRIANLIFRNQRAVILRKLIGLRDAGCDVEGVFSYIDADILAGLASAGIPVHPLWLKPVGETGHQVLMHSKFWTVDAKSTVTGARAKITYAGSSNWRADEQYSDDLLLRIVDDGVYDAYTGYWNLIKGRALSDLPKAEADTVPPASVLTPKPAPNRAGWNHSDVIARIAGADNHDQFSRGFKRLHVEMSGAQNGTWDFAGGPDNYTVQELPVTAEGDTAVTFSSEDQAGNVETPETHTVRIDKTAPALSGLPRYTRLWPPDHRFVQVADVQGLDLGSGVAHLRVSAWSNYAARDRSDIVIRHGSIWLRAAKGAHGRTRVYWMRATATDRAGNATTVHGTCVVGTRR